MNTRERLALVDLGEVETQWRGTWDLVALESSPDPGARTMWRRRK